VVRPRLHSFPTRRSSDLLYATSTRPIAPSRSRASTTRRSLRLRRLMSDGRRLRSSAIKWKTFHIVIADEDYWDNQQPEFAQTFRSEEHTSELQSPDHLVC